MEVEKKCKICQKTFIVDRILSNAKYCSDECRNIGHAKRQERWWAKNRAKVNERRQQKRRERQPAPITKKCTQCGAVLESNYQRFCLDCLLKNFAENHRSEDINRLRNRGFMLYQMYEEAEKRGYKCE